PAVGRGVAGDSVRALFPACREAFPPYVKPIQGPSLFQTPSRSPRDKGGPMSLYPARPSFATVLRSFASAEGMPFTEVLTEQDIQTACDAEGVCFGQGEEDVYTPAVTLWALLAQCLSACKSCVAAVARVLVLRVALGLPPCGAGSGAYCKARAKLPESLLSRLTLQVGVAVERQAPDAWRWQSRRVLLADGCEVSMPDTPANQKAYPQLRN